MKFYRTKYVCSAGKIEEVEGKFIDDKFVKIDGLSYTLDVFNREVFSDRASAIANARLRISTKIASLKKQIANLEAIKFEVSA